MHRLHSGLTIAVPVKNGKSIELRSLLKNINASVNGDPHGMPGKEQFLFEDRQEKEVLSPIMLTNTGDAGDLSIDVAGQSVASVDSLLFTAKSIAFVNEGVVTAGNEREQFTRTTTTTTKPICDFESSETTMFVSGVILPAQNYGDVILPETLVFATSYCGSLKQHLKDLMATCKPGLCQIFSCCAEFPGDKIPTDEELILYMKKYKEKAAFNSRYNCITKQDVRNEKALKTEIQHFLDSMDADDLKTRQDPLAVKKLIQEHIRKQEGKYDWADMPAKDSLIEFLTKKRAIVVPGVVAVVIIAATIIVNPNSLGWFWSTLIGIAIVIGIVALVFLLTLALRLIISRDKNPTAARPSDAWIRKVSATQLRPVINEMTAAAPLKKGVLRRNFYYASLRVIDFARSHLMNVPTVSSIRWLSIDKKRRLLFLSNYSNTTDFYVREFLTGGTPRGVNFMFTNGQGFPDARMLTKGGISDDPEGYMNVIHTHQHVTDLWYAHDYHLTVDQILRQRQLRNGLYKEMNVNEARSWLKLI